jgi:hypothetical protein
MKKKYSLAIAAALFGALCCAPSSFAQEPGISPPASAKPPMLMPPQRPDMGAMYSQMINATFTELTKPEHAAQLAKFQRLYYEALKKEGFTHEEALSVVKATQLPLAGGK